MKKFAVVFPGQGSQSVGMLKDFMADPEVKRTYAEANEALGYDLLTLTLEGPESELNKTEVTQPAILTASIAAYRALVSQGVNPQGVAGHSLGEYSALVASGSLNFQDAVKLVRLRGQAMQEAVPQGQGAMAAILGVDDDKIIEVCKEQSQGADAVWAANFNSPGQVVISGTATAVERANAKFTELGAKRVVPLAVSAPSHCPLMQSAADKVKEVLLSLDVKDAVIPVYCNALASKITKKDEIIDCLYRQLVGPVRWVESVQAMAKDGIELLVEAGPGKVLTGLNRRIDKTLSFANVNDPATLEKALSAINS